MEHLHLTSFKCLHEFWIPLTNVLSFMLEKATKFTYFFFSSNYNYIKLEEYPGPSISTGSISNQNNCGQCPWLSSCPSSESFPCKNSHSLFFLQSSVLFPIIPSLSISIDFCPNSIVFLTTAKSFLNSLSYCLS